MRLLRWTGGAFAFLTVALLQIVASGAASAQPAPGVACVVTAGNRNAPLAADGTYTIFGIPGDLGAVRARATCSDGSFGQSSMQFTYPGRWDDFQLTPVLEFGQIEFGRWDPVPAAVQLSAPTSRLTTGQTAQMQLLAVGANGQQWDATLRSAGTTYYLSNRLLASVTDDGLVTVHPLFAAGSSARVLAGATAEGAVTSTMMFTLGPRGQLAGRVVRADGATPVSTAQVSVVRLQPMEAAGSATTDSAGEFQLADVNAGSFLVSAIDPETGDRALAFARIESEGETAQVELRMNGLATVNVSVVDADDQTVAGAVVTYTALGAYRTVRNLEANAGGALSFVGVPAGDFTVSTRDPVTRLIGAAVARVEPGQVMDLVLRLQPVGQIEGRVLDIDGVTPVAGVQVRVASRERGILTQSITAQDGGFGFDSLPLSDGPYTLDAFVSGRLRARVPGVVLSQPNQIVQRDIVFGPIGAVVGRVRNPSGVGQPNARVVLQSLEGLNLRFTRDADAQGRFEFTSVPVGAFELTAVTTEGRAGRSAGTVGDNSQQVELDVVVAEDALVGRVFQRDGITPVGAGVQVYLAPRSIGLRYSLAGHPASVSTQTDADGRYGFTVPSANTWVVQAEQGPERGRTEVVVANLNPSQPLVADLVFLAKGSVSGSVRDSGGSPQANVPVTVRTEGAFVAERLTQTNALGRYSLDGVFAGSVSVLASNMQTQLSGVANGRLDAEGQSIDLDVTLYATGTIQGQVLLRQGGAVSDPVRMTLRRNGQLLQTLELTDGHQYRFEAVPLGDIRIEVERLSNGDRGVAMTRLNAAGEVKNLPVRLVGQAAIAVGLVDAGGAPVAGARVVLSQSAPFRLSLERQSDSDGSVRFEKVFAGDFSISASKPAPAGRLSGSASGTLLPGVDQQLQIVMQAVAYGRIAGTVHEADGLTPVGAGKVVRMLPEPFPNAFVAVTDENGQYAFDSVDAGSYTIDVLDFFAPATGSCPNRDRVRGRATGVTLSAQDEEVVADIQLIGRGSVGGVVVNAQGQPVAGIEIRLTNPDPVYGANVTCSGRTTFDTFSDASGAYLLTDVPPGDFTVTAENVSRTMRAEAQGRVRFDGDEVELELVVIDSAITMPHTFYDANGFRFDIQGTGSIGTGTNNVFEGSGPDNAGMRLELIHNGMPVPFLNGDGSIGRLDVDGQQVEVDDTTPSGLFVTRRMRAPRSGYFSRYLEILENPTTAPVTVSVRVRSHHRSAQSTPRVVDTSDGDQVLSVSDSTNPDRWALLDDQLDADPFSGSASIPATGHLFDGAGAAARVGLANYQLIGTAGRLTYQWNDVTVPAGGRVILMHFAFNQINREAAREAAVRLSLLPPEAIADLTTDERADVLNFAVPEQSLLPPLPNLDAGELTGTVFSGDSLTPVPGARVRFKSLHPLFGRPRFVDTGPDGDLQYRSTLTGMATNYVIPVYAFELSATYPRSGAQSTLARGDFEPSLTRTEQDLMFFSTGDITGVVQRHNGAPVADARVNLCRLNSPSCTTVQPNPDNHAYSGVDGRYNLLASDPRDYFLFASKSHPQGRSLFGQGVVAVAAGGLAVADITLEPTGSVGGAVRVSDGTPVVNARVNLLQSETDGTWSIARSTTTDTAGHYRLSDVFLGSHRIHVRDTVSGAEGEVEANVSVDVETQADVTLAGFGALRVRVQFARGLAAANAPIQVLGTTASGTADSNGEISFQLPLGSYEVSASHPENFSPGLAGQSSATIETLGQQVDALVLLQPAGAVLGTISRPDGTTLAGGFPYAVRQIRGGTASWQSSYTDNAGNFRVSGLPVGGYVITAYDSAQDRYADAEFDVSEDGEEVLVDLVLLENRIPLPATLRDANRFAFDVQRSGALAQGDAAFHDAGVALEVNGQPFTGETSARLEANRRQFVIEQPGGIDGLLVTRRIYVPRGAYFARYIETLENPTTAPIQVAVRLTTRFAGGQVRATSSDDTVVDSDDHWAMVDDGVDADIRLYRGQPATAHVWAHERAGAVAPTTAVLEVSDGRPRLRQAWQDLVVPPGRQLSLVHFVVQQVNRDGALFAVNRLTELPPEALADLPPGVLTSSLNFAFPDGGQSDLAELPPLTGSLNGMALEGDSRTPVRGAHITVQSTHPLFNRVWGLRADGGSQCGLGTGVSSLVSVVESRPCLPCPGFGVADAPEGSYRLQGQLTAEDSIALPEGVEVRVVANEDLPCYSNRSGHPLTRYPSRDEFVLPGVEQNVIWDTGLLIGTVVGSHDFSVTQGRIYLSTDNPLQVNVPIAPDGTYVYPGLPPGRYDLLFDTQHPQGSGSEGGLLRGQRTEVEVTLGAISVVDVSMQPVGSLQGTLLQASGEPSRSARITLEGPAVGQVYDQCSSGCVEAALPQNRGKRLVRRQVMSDSLGRYSFSAVPSGSYTLTAIDPSSDSQTVLALDLSHEPAVQNLVLNGVGQVTATMLYARGTPVIGRMFSLSAESISGQVDRGPTDSQGRHVLRVPAGEYTLAASHPLTGQVSQLQGVVASHGEASSVNLVLGASASLRMRIVDGDNGGAPIVGARVAYTPADTGVTRQSGLTDANGWVQINDLREATYAVVGYVPDGRTRTGSFVVDAEVDGQLVEQILSVQSAGEVEGSFTFAQGRQLFSVYAATGGGIAVGIRSSTSCDVRAQVYSPAGTLLAAGYGRGPSGSFAQINEQGDLQQVPTATTGYYTIAVSPRVTSCFNTGYRLSARVAGELAEILAYQSTSRVHGRLLMPDGVTPVGSGRVRLRVTSHPQIGLEQFSDEQGVFDFPSLPLGAFTLEYVPATGAANGVQQNGWMILGQQVEQDLILPATTTVNVTVLGEGEIPVGAGVQVRFQPRGLAWIGRSTNAEGRVSYTHISNSMLAVRAVHPTNSTVFDEVEVAPADGQVLDVTLAPRPASVSGRLLGPEGQPMAGRAVSLDLGRTGESLADRSTDTDGRFSFPFIPAGVPLMLSSNDPLNSLVNRLDINVPPNQNLVQDLRLNGRGTLTGQVTGTDGIPLSNVQVEARYVSDDLWQWTNQVSDYTGASGNYQLEHLPVSRDLELRVSMWIGGNAVVQSQTVQLENHGQALISDIVFDVPGGSLHVRVLGSDGLPADGECQASYSDNGGEGEGPGGGGPQGGPCSEGIRFNGVPPGEVVVSGYANAHDLYLEERVVDIVADELSEVIYRFGVVSGAVSFSGGEPAEDASVRLIQDSAMQYASTRTGGSYRVLGAQVGELVVEAEDNISGLTASSAGELMSEDVPVTVNIVLPESGLVEGDVRDHQGTPVANALVYARSADRDFDRSTYTDAQGRFAFDRIAFGSVQLVAVHPDSGVVATAQALVDQPDQVVSVQLNFEQPASLTGTVLRPDGQPAAFVCVTVISTEEGLGYSEFQRSGQTSSTGEFSFSALILGQVEVHASSCTPSSASAIESVELRSGQASSVDLQIGTALRTGAIVLSETVSGYTLRPHSPSGWWARRPDNNWHTAYDQAYRLSVDGVPFPWRQSGRLLNDARTVEFSSQAMSGVRVQRRVDVPLASGYARLLDTFVNPGAQPVEISVGYSGRMTQWGDIWSVLPAVTAGRYLISSPAETSGLYASGNAAHVVGGIGGAAPEMFDVKAGQTDFSWSWTLQLAPGEVAHLLQYSVPRLPSLFAEAEAQAQALSNMTDPSMFDGLTESERAGIRNFQVPAQ